MVPEVSEVSPRELEVLSPDDIHDAVFAKRGCCFWIPCLGGSPPEKMTTVGPVWWERMRTPEKKERWWSKGWKSLLKVREWSEIVAGPRWKTFIRRFNKNRNNGNGGGGGGVRHVKFNYDPLSYSLNFDEGPGQNCHYDEDHVHRDFSSRYASVPVSAKSSMDLGKDGPSFT